MPQYIITTSLAGAHLPEGDTPPEPFEATPEDALSALLDEADSQLDDVPSEYEDEVLDSDRAYIESLRGSEGRGDLLHHLHWGREVSVRLESLYNSFGGVVTLTEVEDDFDPEKDGSDNYPAGF